MTDRQFQLLDELYFVTSFAELRQQNIMPVDDLLAELEIMRKADWVNILFPTPDQEADFQDIAWQDVKENCFFLATKAGLFAHNGRD